VNKLLKWSSAAVPAFMPFNCFVVCCVELVGTKARSGWVTAALTLLLVRLVLH